MTDQPRNPLFDANPPASIEAEKALLGSVMINPDAFLTISAFLKADDFFFLRHQHIWSGMLRLSERREPIDIELLAEELGATLAYVLVNDIRDDIYYARLVLDTAADKRIEIDCRPSDAIAIAVRTKVPLYVAEAVLDRAGIRPELDVEAEPDEGESDAPVDTRKLSAFADFLDTLDLDDLGAEDDK